MAFEVYGASENSGGGSRESTVDWGSYNEYIVNTVGLQNRKPVVGVISNIVDLGLQPLPDSEYDVDKEDVGLSKDELLEKYAENVEAHKNFDPLVKRERGDILPFTFDMVYDNKAKEKVLKKLVSQVPRQCVAVAIDIPSKQLDLGQFFGDDSGATKPLRIWYGGSWYNPTEKKSYIQNLTAIRIEKNDKLGWTIKPNNLLYKLAVATGLINESQPFTAEQIDQLVGRSAQFEASVGFNVSKTDPNKKYLSEKIKLMGALMEGMPVPTLDKTTVIQFNGENESQDIKEIRLHIKNTIKNALNYEKSKIKGQLESLEGGGVKVDESKADAQVNDGDTTSVTDEDF